MDRVNRFAGYLRQQMAPNTRATDHLTYRGSRYPKFDVIREYIKEAKRNPGQYHGVDGEYIESLQNAMASLQSLGGVEAYNSAKDAYYSAARADNFKQGSGRILSKAEIAYARILGSTFQGNAAEGGGSQRSTTTAKIGAAVQKFAAGGKVDLPNIRPSLSGIKGSQARTVKHMIDFNIGGRNVGPFEADKSSISDLITELKRAQRLA